MRLSGLEPLYRSMHAQNIERTKFRYQHNHLTFECMFFIDLQPFELVMGCIGHNFTIFLEVRPGFEITPFIERETFFSLREALFQGAGSPNKFDPTAFFTEFNRHIPNHTSPENTPEPHEVARYYRHVEEADKIYFCGWRDNTKVGKHVTAENLAKTLRLLGERAHELARRRNLSTCWTDVYENRTTFAMPA